jgi:hypothetical protein
LKQKFISHLLKVHPTLNEKELDELISPQLLSPFEIRLPKALLDEAQDFVDATFKLRESSEYQRVLAAELQERGLKDPGNKSICMSYDFHVDSAGHLKLIEINTNAAFQALGFEMYKMRNLPLPVADFTMNEFKSSIETELKLQGKNISDSLQIAIIDEEPEKQRLFVEFLVFQSYFQKWGWNSQIADFRKVPTVDFIYNRFTDFYLSGEESKRLKDLFLTRQTCFSPNPFEYCLLADKQRMIDWSSEDFWKQLPSELQDLKPKLDLNLPLTKDLCPAKADEIWAERKKFFFKPKRAFGAKQSYRGGTISHRNYLELVNQEMIAQEYVPAPEVKFQTPEGEQSFKYDLRFYVYRSRVQFVVARTYQGQVTNLKTPYGGFTPVIFE